MILTKNKATGFWLGRAQLELTHAKEGETGLPWNCHKEGESGCLLPTWFGSVAWDQWHGPRGDAGGGRDREGLDVEWWRLRCVGHAREEKRR